MDAVSESCLRREGEYAVDARGETKRLSAKEDLDTLSIHIRRDRQCGSGVVRHGVCGVARIGGEARDDGRIKKCRQALPRNQHAQAVDELLDVADDVGPESRVGIGERHAEPGDGPLHGAPRSLEVEGVRSPAAIDGITAVAAPDVVVAVHALDVVIAMVAEDSVGGAVPDDGVVGPAADDVLDHGSRGDDEARSAEEIGLPRVQIDRGADRQRGEVDGVDAAISVFERPAAGVGRAERCELVRVVVVVVGVARAIGAHGHARHGSRIDGRLVGNPHGPDACGEFAQMSACGEYPVAEVSRAARLVQQVARGSVRRDQLDHEIARIAVRGGPVDLHLDRLDGDRRTRRGREINRSGEARGIVVGDKSARGIGGGDHDFVGEGLLQVPALRQLDGGEGVDQPETIVVAEVHATVVPVGGAGELPGVEHQARARRLRAADLPGGDGEDLHHVAVAKRGVCLEDQANDSAGDGCCRRRAAETGRVVAAAVADGAGVVRGRDAERATIRRRGNQQGRAGGRVV